MQCFQESLNTGMRSFHCQPFKELNTLFTLLNRLKMLVIIRYAPIRKFESEHTFKRVIMDKRRNGL